MTKVNINLRKKIALRLHANDMKKAGLKSDYLELPAGESEVPDSIADHWYVKAHLVKKPAAPQPAPAPQPSVADQAKAMEKAGKKRLKDENDETFVARILKDDNK